MASKVLTQNDLLNVLAHINLGDDGHMELTQAEFDQLTQEEKDDGTIYFITDGVSGNVFLDDNTPIGTIAPYGGTSDPTYWLICDGRAISRTAYADLFAVIGTTYGSGNGSTTFNIPDLRGKVPMGTTTGYAMGSTGGEIEHTLQTSEIPAHTHGNKSLTGNWGSSQARFPGTTTRSGIVTGLSATRANYFSYSSSSAENIYGFAIDASHEHDSVGGSGAHNNLQPYTVTNYIIKAQSAVSESQSHLDMFYPVGSYYETSNSTFNPNTKWGGTWELVNKQNIIHNNTTGISMPANTETIMASITLPANNKYLIVGATGTGTGTTMTTNANIRITSGTGTIQEFGVNSVSGNSGNTISAAAYIETTTQCVASILKYNYTSSTITSSPWGRIIAIPLNNMVDGNYKWHRTA